MRKKRNSSLLSRRGPDLFIYHFPSALLGTYQSANQYQLIGYVQRFCRSSIVSRILDFRLSVLRIQPFRLSVLSFGPPFYRSATPSQASAVLQTSGCSVSLFPVCRLSVTVVDSSQSKLLLQFYSRVFTIFNFILS